VLLEDVADVSEVTLLAERIQAELARPFLADGHEVYTGASIGIALSSTGYQQPEDLLRDADTAMYRAKAGGRGGYAVFDASMHARAVALLNLESDLRRALERHELRVHYQPVVELAGGHVVGVEALVRWRHPGRGLLSPAEFIAVAEETGLIVGIGDFVLAEACAQLRRWRDDLGSRAPAWVSVNLSPRGLARPGLAERVQALLASHGLESGSLWLEITEDTLMADAEAAVRTLNALRDTGVRLCLDDFGTGHSSLGYLHRFPIQTLKIDRSFIGGAGSGVSNLTIATSVIALAHGLGVDVIAEGVETAEQLAQLRELHCEYGQGFLFARPLPAAGLAGLLGDDRRW
jgi:EAL domain-containing protein (putative c-di-GMP-specific phosphodiesterase class I)